jgi:uncharacterized protein YbjT (DUF2867 family)
MMLVTGASGHVGSALVRQLAAGGVAVRAMTRRPASLRVPDGVDVVAGDCDDPASLGAAFAGVEGAFLMSAQEIGAGEPTHDLRLVAAARAAGVRRIVKLSVYDGGERPDVIGRWHRKAEDAVMTSGLEWTVLRPGRFMSNALGWKGMLERGDTVYAAWPDLPAVPIDPADIAAVAAAALTGDGHAGEAYKLSGPEILTPAEEIAIVGSVLGRPLSVVEPSEEQVAAGMRRGGMSEEAVAAVLERLRTSPEPAVVLSAIPDLLGRPATSFADYAKANFQHPSTVDS